MIPAGAVPWVNALNERSVAGYKIGECVGAGTFGMVFAVVREDTGAAFAMKVHPANTDSFSAAEFENEGLLLGKLIKCSNVINIVDSGEEAIPMLTGPSPMQVEIPVPIKYIVMTIASGNLEEITGDPARLATLAWEERISLWRSAIKGVHQMHLKSVAHRDLKSSNCLVVVQGNRSEIRLADLGRSKAFTLAHSMPPQAYLAGRGDRRFAPPEYLWHQGGYRSEDFRRADLYGLGSLFAELVVGHPMTALAVGSWQDAVAEGQRDFATGYRRDLSVLRPQFRRTIAEIGDQLPRAIRHDGIALLALLCDPLPQARVPTRDRSRKCHPEIGLHWLLRRVDILSKRLHIDTRRCSYGKTINKNRSA